MSNAAAAATEAATSAAETVAEVVKNKVESVFSPGEKKQRDFLKGIIILFVGIYVAHAVYQRMKSNEAGAV